MSLVLRLLGAGARSGLESGARALERAGRAAAGERERGAGGPCWKTCWSHHLQRLALCVDAFMKRAELGAKAQTSTWQVGGAARQSHADCARERCPFDEE